MKIFTKSPSKLASRLIFLLWLLITVAALVQMQRLWWNRERAWYLGKELNEQRTRVFKNAGISSETLDDFLEIDSRWPLHIHYRAKGDHNTLSYGTYLLIPRIPSGSAAYSLSVEGAQVDYRGNPSPVPINRPYPEKPNFFGFMLSVFLVGGVGLSIRRVGQRWLSVPQMVGISCFILMSCTLISHCIFEISSIGFKLFALWGGVGWSCFLYIRFRDKTLGTLLKKPFGKLFVLKKHPHTSAPESKGKPNQFDFEGQLPVQFSLLFYSIGFFVFLWAMQMAVVTVPDDWDAWAVWGAKAKVLALTEGPLKNVTYFGNADYPLLWPAVWAFSGWCSGGWEEHWSKGWSVLFMALTAWEIGLIIQHQTRRIKQSLFGAIFFLSIPMVPLVASWSYAETALSLMLICSFGCLIRWRDENTISLIVLGAIFAVAAAYTKNEGLLFAFLAFFWMLAYCNSKKLKMVGYYVTLFTLLYAPWYFWTRVGLDLNSNAIKIISYHPRVILYALKRIPDALLIISNMWKDIQQWNLSMGLMGLAVAVYLAKGNKHQRLDILLPIAMLLGYLFILVHHKDLGWHIGTAWNRLTLQTLPLLIVAVLANYKPRKANPFPTIPDG